MNSHHVSRIVDQFFQADQGILKVQSHSVAELQKQFGSPLFIYDQSVMKATLQRLQSALGTAFSIYYSMKANPDPRIVEYFANNADGIEVASIGEFRTATRMGCQPANILFAGPGKRFGELRESIQAGIGEIHAESVHEIKSIERIGKELGHGVEVCLRINPGGESQGGAMRMGGLAAPFGIDEEKIEQVIEYTKSLEYVTVTGIHLFAGTQILDGQTLLAQYKRFVELASRTARLLNRPLKTIDFGGGLGVPYFENEDPMALEDISSQLQSLANDLKQDPMLAECRLIVEPGRFLTAEAGIYVSQIIDIKESRGTRFVVVDGGMHHHLAASGNLGQVIKRNFPIACLNRLDQPNAQEVEIVGPLCTPLDKLGRKVTMPELEIGDLIGIFCSGAYGRSASPNDFLSHGNPAEIFVQDGKVTANHSSSID